MVQSKNVDYIAIGKRVKEFRVKQEMSQEQLAERANLSITYISNVENAHSKASLPTFIKIANALGSGVDALLCDNIMKCRPIFEEQLSVLLNDCSDYELKLIVGMAKSLKEEVRTAEAFKKRTSILNDST